MSNTTEQLRAELDERGVEWWEEDGHTLWYGQSINHAASAFSSFMFGENDKVHLNAMVTPAQAIEATLGPRKCRDLGGGPDEFGEWYFVCSECKCEFGYDSFACEFADGNDIGKPHYCPNCGAKVIESE